MTDRRKILNIRPRPRLQGTDVFKANEVIASVRGELRQKEEDLLEARKLVLDTAKLLVKERDKNAVD
jgi:hypothetical protein